MEPTLKEKLDYIWNRPGVLHPNHLNRFYWDVYKKKLHCIKGTRRVADAKKQELKWWQKSTHLGYR